MSDQHGPLEQEHGEREQQQQQSPATTTVPPQQLQQHNQNSSSPSSQPSTSQNAAPAVTAGAPSQAGGGVSQIPYPHPMRPYRSRRNRPCDFCRRRKTRCDMLPEGVCVRCKKLNGDCTFVDLPAKKKRAENRDMIKKTPAVLDAKNKHIDAPGSSSEGRKLSVPPFIQVPSFEKPPLRTKEDAEPLLVPDGFDSAALIGLSSDQDPYLLKYYNFDEKETFTFVKHAVRQVSDDPLFPVQFLAYKDSEKTAQLTQEIKDQRKRILDKVNKLEERLLALYFRFAYPTYPIVDRESFYYDYHHNKDNIDVGLLAGLLALSCIWWKYDSLLCVNPMPKNLSEDLYEECAIAVRRESRHPSIASVQCLLLLLQKRLQPSDNAETFELAVDIAKLVAISHNLGLHLDCSNWTIGPTARRLRKRLWTAVYIMEKWTTVNVGRPSLLNWSDSTVEPYTSEEPSAQLFVQMCKLTMLLDNINDDLYSVKRQKNRLSENHKKEVFDRIAMYFQKLEDWREALPEDLRDMQVAAEGEFCKNGTLNLAALTVEALLHKVRLRAVCIPGLVTKDEIVELRAHAAETIHSVIRFTSEITHSHLHAFWYSTTRLNFSTIAHFMYFHHVTSPTRQEHRDTREMLRKWLFALRVLAQGWEEGTGLAALRMDAVFWMGSELFTEDTPGLNGHMEHLFEQDQYEVHEAQQIDHSQHHHEQHSLPPQTQNINQQQNPHPHEYQGQPEPRPQHSLNHNYQYPADYNQDQAMYHHNQHHHHENGDLEPDVAPEISHMTYFHPMNHDYPIMHQPEQLAPVEEQEEMLLLNEDIMPQEEQNHLLQEDVPENLEDAYAEYFSNDRFHDEGFLTQDLHTMFQVHTNNGLLPDSTFV